jgi:hypothetical protein
MTDDVKRRTKEERKGKTLHVNASNPFFFFASPLDSRSSSSTTAVMMADRCTKVPHNDVFSSNQIARRSFRRCFRTVPVDASKYGRLVRRCHYSILLYYSFTSYL